MAEYQIPPWLRGPNPGELGNLYMEGLRAGQAVQMQKAKLAQEDQQFQMQMQAQAEQRQREALREQTQMDIQKQYQQAQIGLRKQELDQQQQKIGMATQLAARKMQAQQRYQQMIQSGVDPAKALLEVGPDLAQSMTGAAALYKSTLPKPPVAPPSITKIGGQDFLQVPTRSGDSHYQQIRPPKSVEGNLTDREKARLSILEKRRKELSEDPILMRTQTEPALKARADKMQSELDAIDTEMNKIAPPVTGTSGQASEGQYKPLPKSKDQLEKGEIYQTKRGPARWDGEQFEPVEE